MTTKTLDLDEVRARHAAFEASWDHEYVAPDGPKHAARSAEDVPALLAEVERLRGAQRDRDRLIATLRDQLAAAERDVRKTAHLERMARRHAAAVDAEVAEADADIARLKADVARLEAVITRHHVELHDARGAARSELVEQVAAELQRRCDEPEVFVDMNRGGPDERGHLLAMSQAFGIAADVVRSFVGDPAEVVGG